MKEILQSIDINNKKEFDYDNCRIYAECILDQNEILLDISVVSKQDSELLERFVMLKENIEEITQYVERLCYNERSKIEY